VEEEDLATGRLVDILPNWVPRNGGGRAVFPTRREVLPGVRLIDLLAERTER
jgi:hypothetical protein